MIFKRDQMDFDALVAAMQTGPGLTEFAIGLACMLAGWWLTKLAFRRWFFHHPEKFDQFLPYAGLRLILPLSAQLMLVLSSMVWIWVLERKPHVLLAFAAMLFWMAAIRLLTALIREALPRGRLERHTENLVSTLLWLSFVTWTIDLDDMLVSWMQSVSFRVGKAQLDLSMILSALLWFSCIMIGALWVSRMIEKRVMRLTELDLNLRLVFTKLSRTVMVVAAVLIALPIVGIDLTVLSVFGGALGVGLGFGLQKIASSYVSGFIILLERSIRIGDRLLVDGRVGYVTRITSRFVVLKGTDGTDALVPNDLMISNTVVNQSYSDKKIWSNVSIDVAYGTDLDLALKLLTQAARHPRVQTDPGPTAYVTLFGPNGISLQVGFWVPDPENGFLVLQSDILLAIWRSFNEHKIKVPLPQTEITLLNAYATPDAHGHDAAPVTIGSPGVTSGVAADAAMGEASREEAGVRPRAATGFSSPAATGAPSDVSDDSHSGAATGET